MHKYDTGIACAMTVAGSDSGAGAGIQADILSFAANGVYGCTAIAALTAQNPDKVSAISAPDSAMLAEQLRAIATFYKPKAAKAGMLFSEDIVARTAEFFAANPDIALVADPVMISTSGAKLLSDDAVDALKNKLIPLAKVVTPNLDEGAFLLGVPRKEISDIFAMEDAAKALAQKFSTSILLKGGHLDCDEIVDVLCTKNSEIIRMPSRRISGVNSHGSGCTLSAAITAMLAKGDALEAACKKAQAYLIDCMKHPLEIGGQKFINHFPKVHAS